MQPIADHFPEGMKPSELKRDPFLNGLCLFCVPDSVLQEADKRKDAWAFLLSGKNLPIQCRKFFEAGKSVSEAWAILAQMHYEAAHLGSNLLHQAQEALANSDESTASQKTEKYLRALIKYDLLKKLPTTFKSQKEKKQFEAMESKILQGNKKRSGAKWKPTSLPDEDPFQRTHKLELFIVHSWLRWGAYPGTGEPGLCFYSDYAMTKMLNILRGVNRLDVLNDDRYFRKMRQRLKLKQYDHRKPMVTDAMLVPGTGIIEVTLNLKDGEKRYRLKEDNRFEVAGVQFYPIPTPKTR